MVNISNSNIPTSTPLCTPQRNLRKSLLRDVTNLSPMRRLNNVMQQSPVAQTPSDDQLERSKRRSEANVQKRISSIGTPQSPLPANEKEIRDHFQICLKMYAENKINAKNAWNLKIIDFMRIVLYNKGQAKDSLQVAGTSLDVSTKIYGIRVDDVHSDGLKLASNMARVNPEENEEDGENDAADDNEDNNAPRQRKKKHKRMMPGQKNTIAKDTKSLIGDVPKLESVFFQTRTNLELSSIDNLFTSKLPMHCQGYKFMLLNKEKSWLSYDQAELNEELLKMYSFNISHLSNFQICAPFNDFEIDEWNPENENQLVPNQDQIAADEVVYDAEGIPIPELDGSLHDFFDDGVHNGNASSEEEELGNYAQHAALNNVLPQIIDYRPDENSICPGDYLYSFSANVLGNKRITQVWAGPSHWKLKYIRRNISRFSGQPEKQLKKSVKKQRIYSTLIDYSPDQYATFDRKKVCKLKRRVEDDPFKCTLPQVVQIDHKLYQKLMLKPVFLSILTGKEKENCIETEVGPYNYENPNDSQYCAQNGILNDDDDGGGAGNDDFSNDEEIAEAQQNFLGDNLVDLPEQVPQTYIPYSLQAKKMDMKKLKSAIWKTLVSERPKEIIPDDGMYDRKLTITNFAEVFKQLPERLPEKMRQDLSCPYAFVAILHLANEQNLEFKTQEDLRDFSIKKATHFTLNND